MKAITIWQPWATLLTIGAKKYETRSWKTDYRGPIAIHAAAKDPCKMPLLGLEEFEKATGELLGKAGYGTTWCLLPKGKIIATAELIDCKCILYKADLDSIIAAERKFPNCGEFILPTKQEMLFGDWTPGRYAWEFANIKILSEPIKVKGQQRVWNWEVEE